MNQRRFGLRGLARLGACDCGRNCGLLGIQCRGLGINRRRRSLDRRGGGLLRRLLVAVLLTLTGLGLLFAGGACRLHGLARQIEGGGGLGCLGGQLGLTGLDPSQGGGHRIDAIRALLLQLLAPGLAGLLVARLATAALGLQPLLLGFEALLGSLGLLGFLLQAAQFGLLLAIVLHQRNAAGADPGTGATLDAVIEVVLLGLVVLAGLAVPVELLRQQADRAGIGALAAADAVLFIARRRQFDLARGHQTVAGLDDGDVGVGQGKAHHGAAHDDALPGLRIELELRQQPADRGPDAHPGISRLAETLAGQGDHPADQGFILDDGLAHGEDGADVEHVDAEGQRAFTRGNLAPGQDLDELARGTGGVFGRDHPHLYLLAIDHRLHGGDGLRLVILDGDEDQLRFEDVADDVDPFGDALGLFTHQAIVAADVGLTLGAIDDQDLDLLAAGGQFDIGRETGAAQADDAGFMDAAYQIQRASVAIVGPRQPLAPLIQTIGLQMDAQLTQARGVGDGMGLDAADDAGGRRMDRYLHPRLGPG